MSEIVEQIQNELDKSLLKAIAEDPGIQLAKIVERFSGSVNQPNATTVRRHVYKLGAMGFLYLKNEIAAYPTKKCLNYIAKTISSDGGATA